jgi:hypothetical protein
VVGVLLFCFVLFLLLFSLCFAAASFSKVLAALNLHCDIWLLFYFFTFLGEGGDRSVFSLHLSFAECESSVMFFFFCFCFASPICAQRRRERSLAPFLV